jgi:hypothetical protein
VVNENTKKNHKRSKRNNNCGIFNFSPFINRRHHCSSNGTKNSSCNNARKHGRQNYRYNWQRLLKNEDGTVVIEFLLVSLILVFLSYGIVEYWVVMTKHQQASHLVNRYLETMSLEGRLSIQDEKDLKTDYGNIGLTVQNIQGPRESQGNGRILRNPKDLNSCKMNLKVTTIPLIKPIWMGALIGGSTGDCQIIVGGETLSERIDP